jgi:hypothetical protein
MSTRLATRIGVPPSQGRAGGSRDVVRFHEPKIGSEARTKGSLFLVAQVTGGDATLARAAREALEALEHDYYYDLSAGALGALAKALAGANRRLFHQRRRLGIPRHGGVGIIGLVVRGREAHVAKLGPASAVLLREEHMYELPPPALASEEDPRQRERQTAETLGEALEVEPFSWQGDLVPGDRLALLSRNLADLVGVDQLQEALASMRPAAAVEHLLQVFRVRGGSGSDGILAIEVVELAATATTSRLEPVRPAEPLAGLPDRSPVPLADAIGHFLHRAANGIDAGQAAIGRGILYGLNIVLAFVPRRRPEYPRSIPRTEYREEERRRRRGLIGIAAVAGMLAVGASVASLPKPKPTEAILRATVARTAIIEAQGLLAQVAERIDGRDLIDRKPDRAKELLNSAFVAISRAEEAGVPATSLAGMQLVVDRGLDTIYAVTRIGEAATVIDLTTAYPGFDARDMVVASDGSLWVADVGRGRLIRVDAATGKAAVVYRSGQLVRGITAGAPWLLATAATDVVLIDRQHQAWRFDLVERLPRLLVLPGVADISPATHLLAALQNRPPLEIFNLYVVDAASGQVRKWSPGNNLPVSYPSKAQQFLTAKPDLPAGQARDLLVDANLWLLQAATVTRVNFGLPLPQGDFSLDPPPDAEVRPQLDYRLIDGATIGDRDLFYVYDAGNARIIAFQRADGAFVRQWLAPTSGPLVGMLDHVLAFEVGSVPDGPPTAYLLTSDRVVRVVLE